MSWQDHVCTVECYEPYELLYFTKFRLEFVITILLNLLKKKNVILYGMVIGTEGGTCVPNNRNRDANVRFL